MSTTPNWAATPKAGSTRLSTANTAIDGSGTMGTIITGGTNGTRVDNIVVAANGTVVAGLVNLFLSTTTGANTTANTSFLRPIAVSAATPSATSAAFYSAFSSQNNSDFLPIFVPAGYTLRAATTIAQSIDVTAIGADF